MMRRILAGVGTIAVAAALLIGGTGAFFSDRETSSGNTFAAGVIDLLVDNESYYNGAVSSSTTWLDPRNLDEGTLFFNFTDLKPDDEGEDTISLHIGTNDAWACMDITMTSNDDNSSNEPELATGDAQDVVEDIWDGELATYLEFVWWADDGDNVLEDDERLLTEPPVMTLQNLATTSGPFSLTLADSEKNIWTGDADSPIPANETQYIGKGWCFGTVSLSPVTQDNATTSGPLDGRGTGFSCNGTTLGNETQTDSVTLDVSFRALQARHNRDFTCGEPERPPLACTFEQSFADAVHSSDQGKRKNGTAVLPDRSDATFALGAPQSLGTPYDNPVTPSSFFSLGFATSTGAAEIILDFSDNVVVNATGTDLKLWEVTGGTSYPDEKVDVYIGNSPGGPWDQVGFGVTRDAQIDIAPFGPARYVRIVDASDVSLFEQTADGYDLDAVQALNCVVSPLN